MAHTPTVAPATTPAKKGNKKLAWIIGSSVVLVLLIIATIIVCKQSAPSTQTETSTIRNLSVPTHPQGIPTQSNPDTRLITSRHKPVEPTFYPQPVDGKVFQITDRTADFWFANATGDSVLVQQSENLNLGCTDANSQIYIWCAGTINGKKVANPSGKVSLFYQ